MTISRYDIPLTGREHVLTNAIDGRPVLSGLTYGISAALVPALAIAALAISVNLVADWVLSRTSSLKGGRG